MSIGMVTMHWTMLPSVDRVCICVGAISHKLLMAT